MDRFILDHARESAGARRDAPQHAADAIRARCCASSSTPIARKICRRGSTRLERDLARSGLPLPLAPGDRDGRPGAHLELPRGVARPVDGDEGRRQVAVVRRRHGRRAREAARLHRAVSCRSCAHTAPSAGVYAHASVGCLHVRPVVNLKTAEGVATLRGDRERRSPISSSSSAARCRASMATAWCAARSPRRCSAPMLYDAFRTVKRDVRSRRALQPRQDRRLAADDVEPALRRRLPYAGPADASSTTPSTAGWDAPSRCAAASARAARRSTGRCARPTWRRGRRSTRRAGARTRCGWRWPGGLREERARRRRGARCARPVPRVPRVQGRVPGRRRRRAFQERVPGRLLAARRARRCARVQSATSARLPAGRAAWRPLSNAGARNSAVRWAAERLLRDRSPADAAELEAADVCAAVRPARAGTARTPRFEGEYFALGRPFRGHVHEPFIQTSASRRPTSSKRQASASASPPPAAAGGRSFLRGCWMRRAGRRRRLRDALYAAASAGEPIVFLEPSCLSAVREDAPALLAATITAAPAWSPNASVLFEELLDRELSARARHARVQGRPREGAASRPLPSESDGAASPPPDDCSSGFRPSSRRSGRRVLRDGRFVRLRSRALRHLARRSASAGCCRRHARWLRTPFSSRPEHRAASRSRTSPALEAVHPAVLLRSLL